MNHEEFEREKRAMAALAGADGVLRRLGMDWIDASARYKYTYNFTWLGRPIIQFPQDMVAVQEIIWKTRPDLVVETGIAHGGSLVFSASMLELLGGGGRVVGVDVEIRPDNRKEIERHPTFRRITMIEGSSTDPRVVAEVRRLAAGARQVLVLLDSNHTHAHVLEELRLYSPLVRRDGYLVVFDTVIEDMAPGSFPDRPWDRGNNPKTAVREFLRGTDRFEVDREIEDRLLLTVAPEGYLRCVRD